MTGYMRRIPWFLITLLLVLVPTVLVVLMHVLAPGVAQRFKENSIRIFTGSPSPLRLATAGEQGMYYRYGGLLSEVADEQSTYSVHVLKTAGSIENLELLRSGEADFAFIQGGLGENLDGIAVVAAIEKQYAHIIVPASEGIDDFRALQGRRVGVGPSGSGFESLAGRVFEYFAFYSAPIQVNDHDPDLAEAFSNNEIDAAFTVYSLFSPAVEKLLDTGWYTLLPITEADAIARYMPGVEATTLPHGLYGPDRGIPSREEAPLDTIAVDTLLVTRADMRHGAVTALLEALHNPEFLRRARLDAPPDRNRVEGKPTPVHPAAARFYARNDPVSSDLFEIASFFLAGLLGLVSLTHYLLGRAQQRRKELRRRAIRPYFEQMLDFGNGVQAAGDPSILTGLLHDMMEVQREAEHAWLRGDLDTEDMENLYAVYGIRSGNAFRKIQNLLCEQEQGVLHGRVSPVSYPSEPDEENFFDAPRVPLIEEEVSTIAEQGAVEVENAGPEECKVDTEEERISSTTESATISAPVDPPPANLRKTPPPDIDPDGEDENDNQMMLF